MNLQNNYYICLQVYLLSSLHLVSFRSPLTWGSPAPARNAGPLVFAQYFFVIMSGSLRPYFNCIYMYVWNADIQCQFPYVQHSQLLCNRKCLFANKLTLQ